MILNWNKNFIEINLALLRKLTKREKGLGNEERRTMASEKTRLPLSWSLPLLSLNLLYSKWMRGNSSTAFNFFPCVLHGKMWQNFFEFENGKSGSVLNTPFPFVLFGVSYTLFAWKTMNSCKGRGKGGRGKEFATSRSLSRT